MLVKKKMLVYVSVTYDGRVYKQKPAKNSVEALKTLLFFSVSYVLTDRRRESNITEFILHWLELINIIRFML